MGRFWEEDRFRPVGNKAYTLQPPSLRSAPDPGYDPDKTPLGGVINGFDHLKDLKDMYDYYPRTGHQMRNSNIYDQVPKGQEVNVRVHNLGEPNEVVEFSTGGWQPGIWSTQNPPFEKTIRGRNPNISKIPTTVTTKGPDGQPRTTPVIPRGGAPGTPSADEVPNVIDREPRRKTHPGELDADGRFDEHYPRGKGGGGWDPSTVA